MIKRIVSILLIVCYSSFSFADTPAFLKKGDSAPFDGILFTREQEQKLRLNTEELNYYKSLTSSLDVINKKQEENLNILQQRVELRDKQIESLTERVVKKDSFFGNFGYFALGALATMAIAYGTTRAIR